MAGSAVTTDKVFAYFVNAAGKIIPAPDTRMSVKQSGMGPEWRRCEAVGAKEIERISAIISRQVWEEKKERTVVQHLREKSFIDQVKVRCRLRIAQSFSQNDEAINRQIYAKIEAREKALYDFIASEFDITARNTGLEMEFSEASTARGPRKREGIA